MLTTFENADRQNRRRTDRERHLKAIQDIINTSDILSPKAESLQEATAAAVDVLSGETLAKQSREDFDDAAPLAHDSTVVRSRSHHRAKKFLPFTCLVIFAVMVLVTLATTGGKNGRKDSVSKAPQVDTALTERYKKLFSHVLDWEVTNRSVLEDEKSAPSKALHWLAYQDVETEHAENVRTRFALATLYFSTYRNVSEWNSSAFWLTSYPVCFWHGIDCHGEATAEVGLVQSVNLSSNNLHGTIPPEISLLQKDCYVLDISYNEIGGSIPDEIGRSMVNLKHVYLGPNRLSQVVPESLFRLSHLTHLYLDSCQLSGTIPDSIGGLSNLRGLAIHDNYMSGTIPPSIGDLTDLRVLNLDYNAIGGSIPSTIGNLVGMVDLRLNSNRLNGKLPLELSNLRILEVLYLDNNELTGPMQTIDFEMMPLLGELQLQNNLLDGTIPQSIGFLGLLQVLYLDGNQLDGPIPLSLASNLFLESIFLFNNKLSGPIPTAFGHLYELKHLKLQENQLTGSVPPEIGNLLNLETLFLNNNTLHGQVPFQLTNLPKLQEAYFHGNSITGIVSLCSDSFPPLLEELTSDCKREAVDCLCCTFCYE